MSIPELWKHTSLRKGTLLQYTGGQELVIQGCLRHYKRLTPNPMRPWSTLDFIFITWALELKYERK